VAAADHKLVVEAVVPPWLAQQALLQTVEVVMSSQTLTFQVAPAYAPSV